MYKYSVWCMRVCVGDVFHSCFQWFSIYILVYVHMYILCHACMHAHVHICTYMYIHTYSTYTYMCI